jgi:uncharacterized membrane protein YgaE (UPF0421/DUF939 family)
MKIIGYRTLKTGIGAAAAIFIAKQLGIEYPISAGIIAILSIQNTKKQSINVALQRLGACFLALALATVIFRLTGFNEITYGIFLLTFIPLSLKLRVGEGIIVNAVAVTHLLVEQSTSLFWWKNEVMLMFVGSGIALLLNLFMPSLEGHIERDLVYIEKKISEILLLMAKSLRGNSSEIEGKIFSDLEERLGKAKKRAHINFNNYFFYDASYYLEYMEMRQRQFQILSRMRNHLERLSFIYDQMSMIADFTEKMAHFINEENTGETSLYKLEQLRDNIRKMPLPNSREEFENRAVLFQFLNELEEFNKIKKEFKIKYIEEY